MPTEASSSEHTRASPECTEVFTVRASVLWLTISLNYEHRVEPPQALPAAGNFHDPLKDASYTVYRMSIAVDKEKGITVLLCNVKTEEKFENLHTANFGDTEPIKLILNQKYHIITASTKAGWSEDRQRSRVYKRIAISYTPSKECPSDEHGASHISSYEGDVVFHFIEVGERNINPISAYGFTSVGETLQDGSKQNSIDTYVKSLKTGRYFEFPPP